MPENREYSDYDIMVLGLSRQSVREDVKAILKKFAGKPDDELALELCVFMANKFDLSGNGWFDEDEEVRARL